MVFDLQEGDAMSATEANHGSNGAPTVNGHALDSVEGVRGAFAYLSNDYNDGDIYDISTLDGRDGVAIESRSARFQHMRALLDARDGGYVRLTDIHALQGSLRIEVQET